MPYPVSPPALPPVINVVQPEDSRRSFDSDAALTAPAPITPMQEQKSFVLDCSTSSSCESTESAELTELAPPASANSSVDLASSAASDLGEPLSVGTSTSIRASDQPTIAPASVVPVTPASRPTVIPTATTFLELPDLDALVQARSQPTRTAIESPVAESELAQSSPSLSDSAAPEFDSETLPLDLPIPDPGESDSELESPAEDEGTDEPDRIESPTIPASPLPTPVPVPAPDGGEVLTIPPPRTREETDSGEGTTASPAGDTPDGTAVPIDPQAVGEVLEVTADRQEFNDRTQIFEAEGNVQVRFRQGVLAADRVRVNIPNRLAVAEGNGVLTRGNQVLRGERFSYNFGLNQGDIQTARGELLIPAASQDLSPEALPGPDTASLNQPITQQVFNAQPVQVLGGAPGPSFGLGNRSSQQANINRLRFEADRAEFDGSNLTAENVRITNDPFSPPELELRSNRVTYNRLSPTRAEIRARNPRLVFDQGFSVPLLVNRIVLDDRQRNSGLFNFGIDEKDRDGFYIERGFDVYSSPAVYFSLTPQILVQRAIEAGGFPDPSQFGLVAEADFRFTPTTTARATANFSSLDFSEVGDFLRASIRAQQIVFNHTVNLEYSYRDRLFNGSLGYQNIQSSIGLVVASPQYVLGDSLINLRYQGSVQYVNAQTDQRDLLPLDPANPPQLDPDRDLSCIDREDRDSPGDNGCVDLTRYQAATTLNRLFFLWFGTPLPATPTEGLRYSPTPVVPYVGVLPEIRGVYSGYSNGDFQASIRGSIGLLGQFGHFSKPVFDYTSFYLGYAKTFKSGESPFLFDRIADEQTLSFNLTQQIYGPLRFGVQLAYNLDTGDEIDTVYVLEYMRRTYSIRATYSTGREAATLTFQLNDFNWTGDPGPFSGLGSSTVESGVIQSN